MRLPHLTFAFVALMLCLLVPVTAQQAPRRAAAVPADRPGPFAAGETLRYDVSWSEFLTAGSATITVHDRRPSFGSTAWYVVAEGQPTALVSRLYALYYKVDTLVDSRLWLPQRGSIYSREGRRERMKETLFNHPGRQATYRLTGAQADEQQQALSGPTHDALSALFALRGMRMARGSSTSFAVADSGELYRVAARVEGREAVRTPEGTTVSAWKVVPTVHGADGRPFGEGLAVWFSDDERRVPLRMQATLPVGVFVLTLARRG
jgi:hypothetical protein